MPGAARNNKDFIDGSGTLRYGPQSTVFVEGQLWSVNGWRGDSHPPCPFPPTHCKGVWVMIKGSPNVFCESIPVSRLGDKASCSHNVAKASTTVFANSNGGN